LSSSLALDLNIQEFLEVFVLDTSTFTYDFHDKRGDEDIKVEPWSKKDENFQRIITYKAPTSQNAVVRKVCGDSIQIIETHTYYFNEKNQLCVDINIKDHSESFCVNIAKSISPTGSSIIVDFLVQMDYNGWFKGTIEELMFKFSDKLLQFYKEHTNHTVSTFLVKKKKLFYLFKRKFL